MALSASLLLTKSDCDKVLLSLTKNQKDLDYKKLGLERKIENIANKASSIDTNVASVQAEINSLITVIAGLPDGATKVEMENRKTKADYKLFTLNQRKQKSGTTALVIFQSNMNELDSRLASLVADITAVTTQKAALPA